MDAQLQQQQDREQTEQQQRIEAILAALTPEDLVALREEAEKRVEEEQPGVKFGRDTLVRFKIEELLTMQYLSPPSSPVDLQPYKQESR